MLFQVKSANVKNLYAFIPCALGGVGSKWKCQPCELYAVFDGNRLGLGWDAKFSENPDVFRVIRETEMRFLGSLRHNDEFDFTIWMVGWQRVRGTRCFEVTRKDNGEVIAQDTQ